MCVTTLMTLHTERKHCLMIEDAEAVQFQHYVPYGSRFKVKNGVESCMLQNSTSINLVHRQRQKENVVYLMRILRLSNFKIM